MIVPPINTDTKIIVNVGMQHNVSPVPTGETGDTIVLLFI
jgi:hypothetical protein